MSAAGRLTSRQMLRVTRALDRKHTPAQLRAMTRSEYLRVLEAQADAMYPPRKA